MNHLDAIRAAASAVTSVRIEVRTWTNAKKQPFFCAALIDNRSDLAINPFGQCHCKEGNSDVAVVFAAESLAFWTKGRSIDQDNNEGVYAYLADAGVTLTRVNIVPVKTARAMQTELSSIVSYENSSIETLTQYLPEPDAPEPEGYELCQVKGSRCGLQWYWVNHNKLDPIDHRPAHSGKSWATRDEALGNAHFDAGLEREANECDEKGWYGAARFKRARAAYRRGEFDTMGDAYRATPEKS